MTIVVYIEPLKTFTSGMPHRGMLKELIKIRKDDTFILVLRKGKIPKFLDEVLTSLKSFKNWKLIIENRNSRISNVLAFLRIRNHCAINVKGDVYLNIDAHYLGDKNRPQIVTIHDLSSVKKSTSSSIPYIQRIARKFAIKNGIKNADQIVSISKFTKDDIINYFKTEKPIKVIHNGIDNEWHDYKPLKRKIQNNYWIWWGGFSKRKNLKRLLEAYQLLLFENETIDLQIPNLILIGNQNKYYLELKEIVNSSNYLSKKIEFKQHMKLSQLIEEVANSKGLIFPSLYEGFGLPVIEAFSQGVPVLTSNSSSLIEISGGLAILIDPENTTEIKEGMKKILKGISENKAKNLMYRASNFSFEKCAIDYSVVIDTVFHNSK